jgi:hypothetical protein
MPAVRSSWTSPPRPSRSRSSIVSAAMGVRWCTQVAPAAPRVLVNHPRGQGSCHAIRARSVPCRARGHPTGLHSPARAFRPGKHIKRLFLSRAVLSRSRASSCTISLLFFLFSMRSNTSRARTYTTSTRFFFATY